MTGLAGILSNRDKATANFFIWVWRVFEAVVFSPLLDEHDATNYCLYTPQIYNDLNQQLSISISIYYLRYFKFNNSYIQIVKCNIFLKQFSNVSDI